MSGPIPSPVTRRDGEIRPVSFFAPGRDTRGVLGRALGIKLVPYHHLRALGQVLGMGGQLFVDDREVLQRVPPFVAA